VTASGQVARQSQRQAEEASRERRQSNTRPDPRSPCITTVV
jgi:hypothetical protein